MKRGTHTKNNQNQNEIFQKKIKIYKDIHELKYIGLEEKLCLE
jgi:hypothetical protein